MKNCGNCLFPKFNRGQCPFFHTTPNPEQVCPAHQSKSHVCVLCGQPFLGPSIVDVTGAKPQILCSQCSSLGASCKTCYHGVYCHFDQDPICQEPKFINNTMNPKRVEATCKVCSCFHDNRCCRRDGLCANYKYKLEDN